MKPNNFNSNSDIEGTKTKPLYPANNKPEYNLTNNDIDKSKPNGHKLFSSNRTPFNPLEPKYVLPTCEYNPPPENKFIRNTLEVNDIEGTSPKTKYRYEIKKPENDINIQRKKIRKDNIKGYDYFDYSDIMKEKFISQRHTNPLEPIYNINYQNEFIGEIEKSKPSPLYKLVYKNPLNLQNSDIKGTQVGSLNKYENFIYQDRSMKINDIKGTQVGSLNKGIKSARCVNPVDPIYNNPGILEDKENEENLKNLQKKNYEDFLLQKEKEKVYIDEKHLGIKEIRPHLKDRDGYGDNSNDISNKKNKKPEHKDITMKRPMSSNVLNSRRMNNNMQLDNNNLNDQNNKIAKNKNVKMENLINRINDFEKRNVTVNTNPNDRNLKENALDNANLNANGDGINNNNAENNNAAMNLKEAINNINLNIDEKGNVDNNNFNFKEKKEKKKVKINLDTDIDREKFNRKCEMLKEQA